MKKNSIAIATIMYGCSMFVLGEFWIHPDNSVRSNFLFALVSSLLFGLLMYLLRRKKRNEQE